MTVNQAAYAEVLGDLREHARRLRQAAERMEADAVRYEIEYYANLYPDRITVAPDGMMHLNPQPGDSVSRSYRAAGHLADRLGRPVTVTANGTIVTLRPGDDPDDAVAAYFGSGRVPGDVDDTDRGDNTGAVILRFPT